METINNTTAITLIGHEIEIEGIDFDSLNSVQKDNCIITINQSILDGDDAGSFTVNGEMLEWAKKEMSEKDEEIQNLAYENKMMAEALKTLGFTQEQITEICSGLKKVASVHTIKFQSIWDGGTEVLTKACLNLETGEIIDIESSDDVEDLDILDSQSVFIKHGNLTAAYDVVVTDDGYFISKEDLKTVQGYQALKVNSFVSLELL